MIISGYRGKGNAKVHCFPFFCYRLNPALKGQCCINGTVIFSHCVHSRVIRRHRLHAMLNVCMLWLWRYCPFNNSVNQKLWLESNRITKKHTRISSTYKITKANQGLKQNFSLLRHPKSDCLFPSQFPPSTIIWCHSDNYRYVILFKGTISSRSTGHGIGVLVLDLLGDLKNTPHYKVILMAAT